MNDADDDSVNRLRDQISSGIAVREAKEKFQRDFDDAVAQRRAADWVNDAAVEAAVDEMLAAKRRQKMEGAAAGRMAELFPRNDAKFIFRRRPTFFIH